MISFVYNNEVYYGHAINCNGRVTVACPADYWAYNVGVEQVRMGWETSEQTCQISTDDIIKILLVEDFEEMKKLFTSLSTKEDQDNEMDELSEQLANYDVVVPGAPAEPNVPEAVEEAQGEIEHPPVGQYPFAIFVRNSYCATSLQTNSSIYVLALQKLLLIDERARVFVFHTGVTLAECQILAQMHAMEENSITGDNLILFDDMNNIGNLCDCIQQEEGRLVLLYLSAHGGSDTLYGHWEGLGQPPTLLQGNNQNRLMSVVKQSRMLIVGIGLEISRIGCTIVLNGCNTNYMAHYWSKLCPGTLVTGFNHNVVTDSVKHLFFVSSHQCLHVCLTLEINNSILNKITTFVNGYQTT